MLRRAYEMTRRQYEQALYRGDAEAMARAEGWERVALAELLEATSFEQIDLEEAPTVRVRRDAVDKLRREEVGFARAMRRGHWQMGGSG